MLNIQNYGSSSEDDGDNDSETTKQHSNEKMLTHLKPVDPNLSIAKTMQIVAAPVVMPTEIMHNPKYEELFAPTLGPENPFKTEQMKAERNILSGFVEKAHISEFQFENQRRTFTSYGYALDPSNDEAKPSDSVKRPLDKKKRNKNDNPEDVTGFLGPWVDKATDYQGRSWMEAPRSETQLRSDTPPDRCFLPKSHIHTWRGHTKGVAAARWFPQTAHLLLSAGMDCRVKIWEVYGDRRCIRTYFGHRQAVRDVNFNNSGKQFVSAAYDRYIKLWDTETGACLNRFTSRKVPYCAKFHPDEDKQHLFVCGTSDKKIICVSSTFLKVLEPLHVPQGALLRQVPPGRRQTASICVRHFRQEDYLRECLNRFTSRKVPYCAKFHPDEDKQHLFVCGTSDKKIICVSSTFLKVPYCAKFHPDEDKQHLFVCGTSDKKIICVSSTFLKVPYCAKFHPDEDKHHLFVCGTSDKKIICVSSTFFFAFISRDIPVDMKYIADPSMHSLPAVTAAPNGKWLACQSMDNKVIVFSALNRFKMNRKKTFQGHMFKIMLLI
ncbi:Pre-mRNA-processing factor 17 [Operophtera brumata]|uniref:Pre-mRNA-processing factor 17 n=1 Tax=Operophtera brumata TaxID=104452 RepID=A0A0L7LP33_OPEBR|nr:Pre-mRNA-processing factor 17 [Operophtera brumata]